MDKKTSLILGDVFTDFISFCIECNDRINLCLLNSNVFCEFAFLYLIQFIETTSTMRLTSCTKSSYRKYFIYPIIFLIIKCLANRNKYNAIFYIQKMILIDEIHEGNFKNNDIDKILFLYFYIFNKKKLVVEYTMN